MYGFSSLINCCRLNPRVRRVMSRIRPLNLSTSLIKGKALFIPRYRKELGIKEPDRNGGKNTSARRIFP